MIDSPCKHCVPPRRHPGCHDPQTCPDWDRFLQSKSKSVAQQPKRQAAQEADNYIKTVLCRARKRKGRLC